MSENNLEVWELWYPESAAAGLYFSRSRINPQDVLLVHAAPKVLTVYVRDGSGGLIAQGEDLEATANTPMALLRRNGDRVEREDIWPGKEDRGRLVLLPGGEAGVLREWWNAEDHSEWRWQVEFYNHK